MSTNTAPTSSSDTGFFKTLIDGNEGGLKADGLTPAQKLSLRFVVIGLIYFGFAAIEGMILRIYQIEVISFIGIDQYFGILTAHPLVGIFGSSYMIVFGAFLFVIPFMMKKPLWSLKVGQASFLLIAIGTFTFWFSGFISHYAPLYTLYWPLPADFDQFNAVGGSFFIAGIALVMVGSLLFVLNVFKSITYTPEGWEQQPAGALLSSALGFTGLANLFRKEKKEHLVPLPVAAIARGSVDVALNALIITFSGVLILVYMIWHLFGVNLADTAIDALLYKNWYWWGLDLVADGLVLIFVAGTWYLLAMLITGRKLFMQNIARAALAVELVVSWTVWSHHLLSDQAQPAILKIVSGELVTAFELITQGIAIFVTLATLWLARPLKMTNELKFLLGGLLGFGLAVPAGIMQADMGLNRILHNTQWIIGPHVHVAILVGLGMTLYAAIYVLWPLLTNGVPLYRQWMSNVHFWGTLLGGIGMGAFMGMAGLQGMLRRTVYMEGEFTPYMWLAGISGALILIGFVFFMINIIMSVGLKGLFGIFTKSKLDTKDLVPAD